MPLLHRLKSIFGLDSTTNRRRSQDDDAALETESKDTESRDPQESEVTTPTDLDAGHEDPSRDAEPTPSNDAADSSDVDVDVIDGIGPAYSERLAAIGINTVQELADANPQHVADETDISPARVERWVDNANKHQ